MLNILASIFRFLARLLAIVFATLSLVAVLLVVLLLSSAHTLLRAEPYKRVLVENKVYEKLPVLVADQLTWVKSHTPDPCARVALPCASDGSAAALPICLTQALGWQAPDQAGNGTDASSRSGSSSDAQCLNFYTDAWIYAPGSVSPDAIPLAATPTEVQACVRETLGTDIYNSLYKVERPPTRFETRRVNACIRQVRRAFQANHSTTGGEVMTFVNRLKPEQVTTLVSYLLPPQEAQQLSDAALDAIFAYLRSDTAIARIPLARLKAQLTDEAGEELILLLLNSQPPCTAEQRAQIDSGNFENGAGPAIYCAATGETLAIMQPEMQSRLDRVASELPDEAILIKKPGSSSDLSFAAGPLGKDLQSAFRRINLGIRLSPLLPLVLLLLTAILGSRSGAGRIRLDGGVLGMAALIALCIGVAIPREFYPAWNKFAYPSLAPTLTPSLVEVCRGVAHSLLNQLAKNILLAAGLVGILALGLIVAAAYMKRHGGPEILPLAAPGTPGGRVIAPRLPKLKDKKSNSPR